MRKVSFKKPTQKRMLVKITETPDSPCWYKKGETHEVGCYIVFDYFNMPASYEVARHYKGINIQDCIVLKILPPKQKTPTKS
jgi:hypothetical protein